MLHHSMLKCSLFLLQNKTRKMSAHLSPVQHDVYVLTKVSIHSTMSLRNVSNVAFVNVYVLTKARIHSTTSLRNVLNVAFVINVYVLTKARMHSTTSLRHVPNVASATVPRHWPFLVLLRKVVDRCPFFRRGGKRKQLMCFAPKGKKCCALGNSGRGGMSS